MKKLFLLAFTLLSVLGAKAAINVVATNSNDATPTNWWTNADVTPWVIADLGVDDKEFNTIQMAYRNIPSKSVSVYVSNDLATFWDGSTITIPETADASFTEDDDIAGDATPEHELETPLKGRYVLLVLGNTTGGFYTLNTNLMNISNSAVDEINVIGEEKAIVSGTLTASNVDQLASLNSKMIDLTNVTIKGVTKIETANPNTLFLFADEASSEVLSEQENNVVWKHADTYLRTNKNIVIDDAYDFFIEGECGYNWLNINFDDKNNKTVSFTRTIKAQALATMSLIVNGSIEIPSGLKVYTIGEQDGETVVFNEVTGNMTAGVPYLVANESNADIKLEYTTNPGNDMRISAATAGTGSIQFVVADKNKSGNGTYGFKNAKTTDKGVDIKANNGKIKAGRAYFTFTEAEEGESGDQAVARIRFNGAATGINAVESFNEAVNNGAIYTIGGQKVNKLEKGGLYIIGGKKVVVK